MRVGIGYDIHRLVKGRGLILAGVKIPSSRGLLGHSDADVVLHALIDAIIGAVAKGDIGEHFPDTEKKFKNISSIELLRETLKILRKERYKIGNIDLNIILEEPKLRGLKIKMRQKLASLLNINLNVVNIKAKTNEGLDAVGQKKAIAVQAVVLIKK
ncbi:MAG: 2-C-methyl-D-erythritol 2,4-cyclodiphosphate synthase [Candidatus Omnitrophota bacterium]